MELVVAIFKMLKRELSLSHIAASIVDRKSNSVSASMFSMSSGNPNMATTLCHPLFFNMAVTLYVVLLHYLNNTARNNTTCVFGSAFAFYLVDLNNK